MTTHIEGRLDWRQWWTERGMPHRTALVACDNHTPADVIAAIRAWFAAQPADTVYHVEWDTWPAYSVRVGACDGSTTYQWEPSDHPTFLGLLVKPPGEFGFTNLDSYVEKWFSDANGSLIRCTLDDAGWRLKLLPDTVPVLRATHNNSCALDESFVRTTCRPGEGANTCAFLTMASAGWQCAKFDSSGRALLDRALRGDMTARRVGACRRGLLDQGGVNTLESTVVKDSIPTRPWRTHDR